MHMHKKMVANSGADPAYLMGEGVQDKKGTITL